MKRTIASIISLIFITTAALAANNPKVLMETTHGNVTLELYADKAPISVSNFLAYVKSGSYDGTIFHRVIKGFMNQAGGFTVDFTKKKTQAPIQNEADNGLNNTIGTIAMARTGVVHSATNQFFINTGNNRSLNHTGKTQRGWGYAVFGKVIVGMDIMKEIENVRTHTNRQGRQNVPIEAVIITKMSVIDEMKNDQ